MFLCNKKREMQVKELFFTRHGTNRSLRFGLLFLFTLPFFIQFLKIQIVSRMIVSNQYPQDVSLCHQGSRLSGDKYLAPNFSVSIQRCIEIRILDSDLVSLSFSACSLCSMKSQYLEPLPGSCSLYILIHRIIVLAYFFSILLSLIPSLIPSQHGPLLNPGLSLH